MKPPLPYVPRYCVWELTLACNANCSHCGSSAGMARQDELSTDEAISLIGALEEAGTASITFSGGEPLLREDWPLLAKEVIRKGMRLEMITNGLEVAAQADAIVDAGFFAVTFSIDGDEATHNQLRNVPGGLTRLLEGARGIVERGVQIGVSTQINRHNMSQLETIHSILVENGFDGWQVQLTMPTGEAAKNNGDICVTPEDLLTIQETLLRIRERSHLFIQAADNLGYMGKYEPVLRGGDKGKAQFFAGCQAGMRVVGITSDGTVRGCLSQTSHFNEGSIRETSFDQIWNRIDGFAYNRQFEKDQLEEPCASCPFHNICRAGCRSLALATTGGIARNPYCLRRLEEGWVMKDR